VIKDKTRKHLILPRACVNYYGLGVYNVVQSIIQFCSTKMSFLTADYGISTIISQLKQRKFLLLVLQKKNNKVKSTSYYDTENKDESRTFIGSSQFDVEYQQYHASYKKKNGNHCQHDDYHQERIVCKHGNQHINTRERDFNELHNYR